MFLNNYFSLGGVCCGGLLVPMLFLHPGIVGVLSFANFGIVTHAWVNIDVAGVHPVRNEGGYRADRWGAVTCACVHLRGVVNLMRGRQIMLSGWVFGFRNII